MERAFGWIGLIVGFLSYIAGMGKLKIRVPGSRMGPING
jgi:hypothetical protein